MRGICCLALRRPVVWLLLCAAKLAGCTNPELQITYVDLRATAVAASCLPGN